MTERSEGIRRRAPVVTPSDAGGLTTERGEGIEDAPQRSLCRVEEGS
jgi:hypothetical protein